MSRKSLHPATLAAQGLGWTDESTGAVVLPMHTATTFLRDPDNQYRRGRSYGRADKPGCDQQRLRLGVGGGVGARITTTAPVLVVGITQERRRGMHRQHDRAGRLVCPAQSLSSECG